MIDGKFLWAYNKKSTQSILKAFVYYSNKNLFCGGEENMGVDVSFGMNEPSTTHIIRASILYMAFMVRSQN